MTPIFSSHYSFNSILTLDKPSSCKPGGPTSIVKICKDNGINECVLVEKGFAGFYEAQKELTSNKINLKFGLKILIVNDLDKKDDDSVKCQHKAIIFYKSYEGYKKLLKIYTKAATDGFYYSPRLDCNFLREIWDDNSLSLAVPFYDSFIYCNNFSFCNIIPAFDFTNPKFFLENNGLPFDGVLRTAVSKYASEHGHDIQETKSIYYENRNDFLAYNVYRCILNRTTLDKPRLEEFCSDEFCFESYLNGKSA